MFPVIIDRPLLARRRKRALTHPVSGADFLAKLAGEDILERLATVSRQFERALCIGTGTDATWRAVTASGKAATVLRADALVRGADGQHPADVVLDDEALPFGPASFDLIVSSLSLHFVNDLPGALIQLRRMLKPDGLFLAILVGADSLSELRQAFLEAESDRDGGVTPRISPFADIRDLGGLLQRAGFALPVTDLDRLTLRYASPFHLMRELRAMGASNNLVDRSRKPMGRGLLGDMMSAYAMRAQDPDGRIRATVSLISLSGWAPHESQQKPLKPGSAAMRLADALGSVEIATGEKTGR